MFKLYVMLKTFRDDRKGATAIEYGLIAALLAVVIIGTVTTLGTTLVDTFEEVTDGLTGAGGGGEGGT